MESLRLGCQEQVGGDQLLRGRGRCQATGEERGCSRDGGVKGTQEGRHPSLTICPVSLEGKFQGGRAHCLVPNLNWIEFSKWLPSTVSSYVDLLWFTQKKLKVPDYWKNQRDNRTTHQGQFHGEGIFYAKGIEEKNRGPASHQSLAWFLLQFNRS